MKYFIPVIFIGLLSQSAISASDKDALKFVPGGTVQSMNKDEAVIKTKNGTLVEVELNRDGSLDEASGDMATKDEFAPGTGLLSLSDAVAALKKEGKEATGEWNLDKDLMRDWEYEFEGVENDRSMEYTVNAKTGKLVKSEVD